MAYACKNQPRPSKDASNLVQDGWLMDESGMTRKPHMVRIKSNFDASICVPGQTESDPQCDGCQWRKA